MRTHIYSDKEERFEEDMSLKSRWFRELRGDLGEDEFNEKLHFALEHVNRCRKARTLPRDPGGGALKKTAELLEDDKKARVKKIANPKDSDSKHFVTDSFLIDYPDKYSHAFLRLKPRRLSEKKFSLQTAKVFIYDEKMRQWNLIEQSGYNAEKNYIWAETFRKGVYAAIALPADKRLIRKLALMRYVYLNMRLGQDLGLVSRADDYFDAAVFEQLAQQAAAQLQTKASDDLVKQSRQLFKESRSLKRQWPRQLPNNGLPEWHIMENMEDQSPELLRFFEIDDIVRFFPFLERLANRIGRWYSMGPWNINGRVKSLVIHPTSSNILYAGAANGGVWKTTNGGNSWKHLWKFEDTMAVGSLAISKSNPSVLYAATGEFTPSYGPSYGGSGIYKSTNSGNTWTNVSPTSEVGLRCAKIDIHPTDPNIAYVASNTGVHKTIDGGDNWDPVLTLGGASDLLIDPNTPDTVYAGVWNKGVYKSTDSGSHWDRFEDNIVIVPFISWFTDYLGDFPRDGDAGWIKLP